MEFKKYKNEVSGSYPWYMLEKEKQLEYVENFCPTHLKEDINNFVQDGYIVVKNSIDNSTCDEAIQGFDDLVSKNSEIFKGATKTNDNDERSKNNIDMYHRIGNTHLASKRIANAVIANKALEHVNFIFRSKPALYTSLYYQRGSAQDIHRDTPYFTTRPMHYYVGFSVSFEDSNEENGCLEVMKGGHFIEELDLKFILESLGKDVNNLVPTDDDTWFRYQFLMKSDCLRNGLVVEPVYTKKGDTIIWHPQLPHGGSIIQKPKSRYSLINHLTPVGVPVYHQDIFFNDDADVPYDTDWLYTEFENCFIRKGDSININNVRNVIISSIDSDTL